MKADLHIHSIYSDGLLSIEQLLQRAKDRNIDIIAITDHDSISSYPDIKKLDKDNKILRGVEISSALNGEEVHILGYFYNNNEPNKNVIDFLNEKQEKRKLRVHKIIEKLKKYYKIEVAYEDIINNADGVVGRPHVAMAIQKKYNYTFDEIFDRFLGNNAHGYVPADTLEPAEAINFLKANNALVVLAHPKFLQKNDVEDLIKLGVDGVEFNYPGQDMAFKKRLQKLVDEYQLVITGGSDFHTTDGPTEIGSGFIQDQALETFLKKLFK